MITYTYRGKRFLVEAPVLSGTVIVVGDLLWLDAQADVKPAADFPWDTNLPSTRVSFGAQFYGVAASASADGETDPVKVDQSPHSVYEVDVPAADYWAGQPLAPDQQAGDALETQQLEAASPAESIARAIEFAAGATQVKATFASAFFTGSANENAQLS